MKVTVKLFALLGRYLPPGAADNQAALEVADGATPATVIDSLNLPREYCHLVLVNGYYVEPSQRESLALEDNDVLAIWPPVAGG
ncbi:MAG: MoaD/ThiS family protein [Rhodospirillales bacterium]